MMEGDTCILNFVSGDYEPSLWAAESKAPEEAIGATEKPVVEKLRQEMQDFKSIRVHCYNCGLCS